MANWTVSVVGWLLTCCVCALLPRLALAGSDTGKRPLTARFLLQVDADVPVQGQFWLDTLGQTCIHVQQPRAQRIWLGRESVVLYDLDDNHLMRQTKTVRSLPSFLDAVVVSLRPPTDGLPKGATLVERRTLAEGVEERWRSEKTPQMPALGLRVVEGPQGIVATDVLDGQGATLRQYRYGGRKLDRGLSLASKVEATYLAKGSSGRREQWQLTWLAASDGPRAETTCLRVTGQPKESKL